MHGRSDNPSHRYQRDVVGLRRISCKLVDLVQNAVRRIRAIRTFRLSNHLAEHFHGAVPTQDLAFTCLRLVESVTVK